MTSTTAPGKSSTLLPIALALVIGAVPVVAQVNVVPTATLQFEHSSNDPKGVGSTFRSDLLRLTGGVETEYLFSRQRAFLDAAYGTVSYDGLPDQGNDEYAFRSGLEWQLGRRLDGLLEAASNKQVSSFYESLVEGNSVQQEERLTAAVNAQLTRRWRVETTTIARSLETPIVEIANFGARESIDRGGVRFATTPNLTLGADYERTDGNFRRSTAPATYTQRTPAAFLRYAVEDLHSLQVRLGRTERRQDGIASPFEKATGDFVIERKLTGKTSVNAQGSRAITNYFGQDAGAFALVDRWNTGVNWAVTGKSTVYADFGQIHTKFLSRSIAGPDVSGRVDRSSSINISVENDTTPWLTAELYLKLDDVKSNIDRYSYDGVLVGLEFKARWFDDRRE